MPDQDPSAQRSTGEQALTAELPRYETAGEAYGGLVDGLLAQQQALDTINDLRTASLSMNGPGNYHEHAQSLLVGGYEFVGAGSDKLVFKADYEGQDVMVKVCSPMFASDGTPQELARRDALPLIAGEKEEHLEHLLGSDIKRGILLTTPAPGKLVANMSLREVYAMSSTPHLAQLRHTLDFMHKNNLDPHNMGGIFGDRKKGFAFVDYTFRTPDGAAPDTPKADFDRIVHWIFSDHQKLDARAMDRAGGVNLPGHYYETTGMRALMRSAAVRRARRITSQEK